MDHMYSPSPARASSPAPLQARGGWVAATFVFYQQLDMHARVSICIVSFLILVFPQPDDLGQASSAQLPPPTELSIADYSLADPPVVFFRPTDPSHKYVRLLHHAPLTIEGHISAVQP